MTGWGDALPGNVLEAAETVAAALKAVAENNPEYTVDIEEPFTASCVPVAKEEENV